MPEVLLVDDEEVFSQLVSEQLGRRGFSVVVASNGHQALDLVRRKRPDAILLDILMPGLDGVEVLKKLKADPLTSSIPVMILSLTMRDQSAKKSLIDLGALECITKPCPPNELASRLNAALKDHSR